MAHNRSFFLEALDRSGTRRDGGFKHSWSFSLPGDGETEKRHEASVVSVEQMEREQLTSPEENKSPLGPFGADALRNRSNMRPQNRLGPRRFSDVPLAVPTPSSTNFNLILTSTLPPGIVLQGRHFQHAQAPSMTKKPVQRNNSSSTQETVEMDSIVLTCPESQEETLIRKRRVQLKRRPLENVCCSPQLKVTEPVRPTVFLTVCLKCNKPSEDSSRCPSCGSSESLVGPRSGASPTPRPSIRPQPPPGGPQPPPAAPNGLQQSFYKAGLREPLPVRITCGRAGLLSNGRLPLLAGTSGCCGAATPAKGGQQPELNDPIVLSSDDEEEEEEEEAAETSSTGSGNRLDNVSPRPADSAHSSPAPSAGRVEAALKSAEELEELPADFFEDANTRIRIPRRARMKDQFGNQPSAQQLPAKRKKLKASPTKCDSIILECRSVRVGTLRRMVVKPVIFSVDSIEVEAEGAEAGTSEALRLRTSELVSCEWCSVRKLPVLFFQTSEDECVRLRSQLRMSRERGGQWYDCAADQVDEKYIVLIFENGLVMKEQMILEDILTVIGRNNNLSIFPTKLTFEEANIRLVNYNKASSQKVDKVKPEQTSPSSPPPPPPPSLGAAADVSTRTRMATRQHAGTYFDEEEDMTDLQPTFSGPVMKLMVYPPPPAKGGILVTNEDLHCLNDGEFLNDVIIDFYLKYLVLEKLKKEDAQRIHVFSSFFYKRLNQRERRTGPDTLNLTIQKKKHNRVKTWTRHVDLFQKDFIFVPINESAHWYLAVICFPGLTGPVLEKNPKFGSGAPGPGSPAEPACEESIPDHCRPLSPDCSSDEPSPDRCAEADCDLGPEAEGPNQAEPEPQYRSELHRISVCYGSGNGDDTCTFSDDQSSCQDDCSNDGNLSEDAGAADVSALASKSVVCKQPCILIMDSLRGPGRSNVVKTLREYLEVEWEMRKATQRSFGKEVMKGSSPRVPQQDNFSDCGVYILQYVESFFENPIPSFHLPMNLSDWFPQQRMKTKRQEIKELILKIKDQQELDRKESD